MSVAREIDPNPVPHTGFLRKAVMARGHSTLKRISPERATPASMSIGISSSIGPWRIIVGIGFTVGRGMGVGVGLMEMVGRGAGVLVGTIIIVGVGFGLKKGRVAKRRLFKSTD